MERAANREGIASKFIVSRQFISGFFKPPFDTHYRSGVLMSTVVVDESCIRKIPQAATQMARLSPALASRALKQRREVTTKNLRAASATSR